MRVNVYAEEMPRLPDVDLVYKKDESGKMHMGLRIFLESSSKLHSSKLDDDRSAVTFWGRERVTALAREMLLTLESEESVVSLKKGK